MPCECCGTRSHSQSYTKFMEEIHTLHGLFSLTSVLYFYGSEGILVMNCMCLTCFWFIYKY